MNCHDWQQTLTFNKSARKKKLQTKT